MPDAKEREQQGLDKAKKYEVTGRRSYLGHAPGSVFEAVLPEGQEKRALEAGVLTIKPGNTAVREGELEPSQAAAAKERAEQERAAIAEAEAADAARSE
jgi:hypothetical protein